MEDYADNYDFVIACACGIEDTDGWYEVKDKMINSRMMDMTEFRFKIKQSENFGKKESSSSGGIW